MVSIESGSQTKIVLGEDRLRTNQLENHSNLAKNPKQSSEW